MLDILGGVASYIVPFLLVLTAVVTIHELGHYFAGRYFGVWGLSYKTKTDDMLEEPSI